MSAAPRHALVVDDDADGARTLAALAVGEGLTVSAAHTLQQARRELALHAPDIVLLDLLLPDGSGMDLFGDPALRPGCEIVLMTGHASLESSIQALRLGATDYLVKPIAAQRLQEVLSRARPGVPGVPPLPPPPLRDGPAEDWRSSLGSTGRFGPLWGRSAAMQAVHEHIVRVAPTSISVFITGESGTGKELVAQALHALSLRRALPFLAVNCGAISPQLIESELFGHERGSFTGAQRQHQGFFERAHGGTLFLDEITEMPMELQVKLLRVLDTGRYMRVGSSQPQEADVRIVAATNRSLSEIVASGCLRRDLLYRLNAFPIELPPLRQRREDIPLLAAHFVRTLCEGDGPPRRFSAAAMDTLVAHDWPGNVRELRSVVQRACVMSEGALLEVAWLAKPGAGAPAAPVPTADASTLALPIGLPLAEAERRLVLATLAHFGHRREPTAQALGISLKTLYNRLKHYRQAGEDESA